MGKSRAQQHLNSGSTIQDNEKPTQFVPPLCNTCSSRNPVNLVCLNTKCEDSQQLKAICPQCHSSLFHSSVSLEIYITKIKAIFSQSLEMIQLDRQKLLGLQESLNQLTFCLENMKQRTYEKLQEQENQYVRVVNTLKTITEVEQTKVPTAESLKDKVAQISKAVILDAKQDELNPVKIHLNFYQEYIDQCEMEIWVRFAKYFSHPKKDLGVKIEETEEQNGLENEQNGQVFSNLNLENGFKAKEENGVIERNAIEQEHTLPSKSSDEIKSENEDEEEDDNEDDDDENDGDYNYRQNRRRAANAATNNSANGKLKGGSFYLQNSSNNNNNNPNPNQSSAQENQAQNNCNNNNNNETSSQSGSSEPARGTHGTIRKIRELSQKEKQTILNEFDKTQDIRAISTKFNIKYRRLYNFIQNSRGPNNQSIRQYSDEDKQLIYNDYVDSKNVREVANKWKLNYDSLYSFIRYKKQK